MELKNMYNNVEKFVLAGVILSIGSLFFLMDQSEEVELSDNISESFSNEGTVDVEITSLVNNANMGNSVNEEAMTTEAVPTFSENSPFNKCGIPQANSTTSSPLVKEPLASS